MGSFFSKLFDRLSGIKEVRLLMLGLDNAGKTTILYKMKFDQVVTTIPTIGFNVESLMIKNVKFNVWDVGGQHKLRPLWRHYYTGSQALIFVVDSKDVDRLDEAKNELHKIISDRYMRDCPLVVFANKSDLDGALSAEGLIDQLELKTLEGTPWRLQQTCAISGDGLVEGFSWLAEVLKNPQNFQAVNSRNPSSPREQDMGAVDIVSGDTGVHLLAQAIQDRQDSVVIEPPPRRPNAPAPAQSFRAPAEPSAVSSFALGPERPLKLFKMEDFEFLKVLGTGTFGRVQLVRYKTSNVEKYFAMKVLRKTEVVRLKQVDHVYSERSLLARLSFPFIVRLYATFQDTDNIYMLLEYAIGGELFSYLRRAGRFGSNMAKFYAAEIVLALEYMHAHNIVYRDLKPENLLLDSRGHMKIADFGFAKVVPEVTWTLCGTPEYLAPEIIQNRGHGKSVDWWSLGVLIYEMIAGYPPFYAETPVAIYEKIVAGVVEFPRDFDPVARDLICRLLVADPCQRLGASTDTNYGVRNHPWFAGIDWLGLYNRTVPAPIVPLVMSPSDTRNFEEYPDESATGRPSTIPLTEDIQNIFRAF